MSKQGLIDALEKLGIERQKTRAKKKSRTTKLNSKLS
jgi:hypothetical protein